MAQAKKSLVEEVLEDAQQVRETALANAKLALSEAFEPRIKSMISRHLQTEMEDEEEMYGEDEMEEGDYSDEMDEVDDDGMLDDPTNADDSSLEEEDEDEFDYSDEMEEGDYSDDMDEEYDDDEEELDLESVIAELEAEMDDEMGEEEDEELDFDLEEDEDLDFDEDDEELDFDLEEDEDLDFDEDEEDEEIIDLEELLSALSEDEDEEYEEEDDVELEMENRKLTSELKEHREAIKILRTKLNEVNLLNAKLLYTTKLFRNYTLSNSQKMRVVESFDRTKSVRETKLVYSTLAESLSIGGGSGRKTRTTSITEGLASKPTTSTKPKAGILSEGNDLAERFKRLVSYNK